MILDNCSKQALTKEELGYLGEKVKHPKVNEHFPKLQSLEQNAARVEVEKKQYFD